VIGCDWGRSNDYTVFLVLLDMTAKTVVAMDRSNRVDYAVQCERLKALSEQWQPIQIIAEQNSIGQVVIEQLTERLRIQPFTTSNASKGQAIGALALAFERGDIRILNDPVLVSELVAYQAERLPSGLMRYGAPGGQHDDGIGFGKILAIQIHHIRLRITCPPDSGHRVPSNVQPIGARPVVRKREFRDNKCDIVRSLLTPHRQIDREV
jgi:hypothetical protein